jgi:hypothetical protein
MKIFGIIVAFALAANLSFGQTNEQESIKSVINAAYVEGIHNHGDLNQTRTGFHPDFEMYVYRNGNFSKRSLSSWISAIEAGRSRNPNPPAQKAVANYLSVDVTGNTASVKLELMREGKKMFTDYLLLYKINGQWKIVSKAFHSH